MSNTVHQMIRKNTKLTYRGENVSRLENLTDAVFGIAITLLIFNLVNPNSFEAILTFTKTIPAFLVSITFLMMLWIEHSRFVKIYSLNDNWLIAFNTLFIALIIFYVYPLRFMTLYLTDAFFNAEINVDIKNVEVPYLLIYYGFVFFAIYFTIFLLYNRALKIREKLQLNPYELFYTKMLRERIFIMFVVPLISIGITYFFKKSSPFWASLMGGNIYFIYAPVMFWWGKRFYKKSQAFESYDLAGNTADNSLKP